MSAGITKQVCSRSCELDLRHWVEGAVDVVSDGVLATASIYQEWSHALRHHVYLRVHAEPGHRERHFLSVSGKNNYSTCFIFGCNFILQSSLWYGSMYIWLLSRGLISLNWGTFSCFSYELMYIYICLNIFHLYTYINGCTIKCVNTTNFRAVRTAYLQHTVWGVDSCGISRVGGSTRQCDHHHHSLPSDTRHQLDSLWLALFL